MKFYSNELSKLIQLITKGQIKALLLFGPNRGLIELILSKIAQTSNYLVTNHDFKNDSQQGLINYANMNNLLGQKELLKIANSTGVFNSEFSAFLQEGDFSNLLCFIGDIKTPGASIKKLFESQNHLALMGCYNEDVSNIGKLIKAHCAKLNYNIDEEALYYLCDNLEGDHLIIKSELEKITNYTQDKQYIDINDVKLCLSANFSANSDLICLYFAQKKYDKLEQELTKLRQQNISEILIIRALLRYFINIYYVLTRVEQGENINVAIKSLTPPIFYKNIDGFKDAAKRYKADEAVEIIAKLQQAEINYKQHPDEFYIFSILVK